MISADGIVKRPWVCFYFIDSVYTIFLCQANIGSGSDPLMFPTDDPEKKTRTL